MFTRRYSTFFSRGLSRGFFGGLAGDSSGRLLFSCGLLAGLLLASSARAVQRPFRVVLDPGHGGSDLGTVYQDARGEIAEKDLTLSLARLVARKLRERGIEATLTRARDQEIALPERTAIANRLGADAFISIHLNSVPRAGREGEGIETYILNNTTDASSRRLAHLENSVLGSKKSETTSGRLDIALILKDLRLDANLTDSKRLACSIQQQLSGAAASAGLSNRGVRQALFHVLLGADMPSVLVEAGFLSSARDRAWIRSPRGQQAVSASIASAIERFRSSKRSRDPAVSRADLSSCRVH